MKNLIKNTCMLIVFLGIFIACDFDSEIDDYRYKYVGSYDFVTISIFFTLSDSTCDIDTVSYRGRIYFSDTLERNELVINFLEEAFPVFTVDDQGIIREPGDDHHYGGFSGDSAVSLYFRSGGLGGGCRTSVEGKKN